MAHTKLQNADIANDIENTQHNLNQKVKTYQQTLQDIERIQMLHTQQM